MAGGTDVGVGVGETGVGSGSGVAVEESAWPAQAPSSRSSMMEPINLVKFPNAVFLESLFITILTESPLRPAAS
jgi:hypothetical protein